MKKEIQDSITFLINEFKRLKFSYPSTLDEQKRIVAKLDECFEAIDKARANVEKNLNNAKELFQSQLNQIFSQKGDGWVEKKLGKITTKIGSGITPRGGQSVYQISGTNLIRSQNIYNDRFEKNGQDLCVE